MLISSSARGAMLSDLKASNDPVSYLHERFPRNNILWKYMVTLGTTNMIQKIRIGWNTAECSAEDQKFLKIFKTQKDKTW